MIYNILTFSQFIKNATGQGDDSVGHALQSHSVEPQTVRVAHPTDGYSVVFVDTPGFDDTFKSDLEILTIIADWLVKT